MLPIFPALSRARAGAKSEPPHWQWARVGPAPGGPEQAKTGQKGGTERITKPVTTDTVAELITPGAEGRFYLHKVLDVKGVHGVRLADGTERYAYPGKNAGIFLGVIIMSLAWVALRIFDRGDVPLLGVLLFAFGIVGFFLTRSNRAETKRQFDGDRPRMTGPAAPGYSTPTAE